MRALIEDGMHPRWRKVDADLIDPLVTSVKRQLAAGQAAPESVARALTLEVKRARDAITELRAGHEAFNARHSAMRTEAEIRDNILAYAAELGAGSKQLRGDRRAFRRFFGHDAMVARFNCRHGDLQRELAFLLERLGTVARRAFAAAVSPEAAWRELDLEPLLTPLLEFDGDPRVATSAFRCLSWSIVGLPEALREEVLGAKTVQAIYRLSLDRERDVWIQSVAVALLYATSSESFAKVARLRLGDEPPGGDDLFVRRRLVELVAGRSELQDLLEKIAADPSPFVRQGLAVELSQVPETLASGLLEKLALRDEEPAVRAAALLEVARLAGAGADAGRLADVVTRALAEEGDEYVLRVGLMIAADAHAALSEERQETWREPLLPALRRVHLESDSNPARRWAAQSRERIWCETESRRSDLLERVRDVAKTVAPGKAAKLRLGPAAAMDDETIGRVLSVAAQDDFGFDVVRRRDTLRMIRGHRFGFRFWRFLHELRNPSPDKRQAFRHTTGRIFEGALRVPSALLSEMSQTKVPGEPLTLSSEGGWRPFLPLVDEVISALEENSHDKPLKLVTSEGVSVIRPPRSGRQRLRARMVLTRRFAEFAQLRNSEEPAAYIARLRELGIECQFTAPDGEELEPSAAQCYACSALPMLAMAGPDLWSRARDYFYSVYENSLGQLFVFLGAATAFFAGRHIYFNQRFFRLRKRVPLIVGGWGTRGKSGTERIKAALFNALGHRVVSKTTGCEAMFLYSDAFGKLHELFLFRPYDKATIWEQVNIVNLSAKLRSHVFLWECMGLTPAYIEIIQRHWMNDDLATICNTYPDHEDLQGPAGVNIPEVMTYFVRRGGHVLTSEQQMTPILEAEAQKLDCRLDKVGWVEPGLLTPDILDRFPYAEHPNNIALVAELGAQLGIEYDFSLKEMADRVVPDLGVLKVYPVADIAGRQLQFVNGCSANERFGALGNWQRLGFDKQDPREEPGVWITAVVNNRADRISRSRVFASIVVEDISVDRLFLVGSNLAGMVGYIRDAFDAFARTLTLFPEDGGSPVEVLRDAARRWRLPTSEEELAAAVEAVAGDGDLSQWRAPSEQAFSEYKEFAAKLGSKPDKADADTEFRALLWKWFERKLVVIWDYHSTGDQTIHRIAEETPPGYLNRIMGLQNIKGTGLDFVYRWQAWDACYNACQQIVDRKAKVAREGIGALVSFKDYGLLSEDLVLAATSEAAEKHGARDKSFQTQLDLVVSTMESTLDKIKSGLSSSEGGGGWWDKVCGWLLGFTEALLDAGDAVRRRKKADRVYRDMAAARISPARAAQEIQLLNKRQKGGWLKKDIEAWRARRRSR